MVEILENDLWLVLVPCHINNIYCCVMGNNHKHVHKLDYKIHVTYKPTQKTYNKSLYMELYTQKPFFRHTIQGKIQKVYLHQLNKITEDKNE